MNFLLLLSFCALASAAPTDYTKPKPVVQYKPPTTIAPVKYTATPTKPANKGYIKASPIPANVYNTPTNATQSSNATLPSPTPSSIDYGTPVRVVNAPTSSAMTFQGLSLAMGIAGAWLAL